MARLMFCNVDNDIKKSVDKKIPKITINERRKIVDKVKTLSKDVHMEIFYFLKRRINEDYTTNQNGVFINLNNIDNNTLYELRKMVNFYNKNEKKLKESYLERYCNKGSRGTKKTSGLRNKNTEKGTDTAADEDDNPNNSNKDKENKVNNESESEDDENDEDDEDDESDDDEDDDEDDEDNESDDGNKE
jgi:hypothetical protein